MGRGGKPIPTRLKILMGNPGKRRINSNKPQPIGEAEMPSGLSGDAENEWNRLYPELTRLGLLTVVDASAFAAYCECWGLYRRACRDMKELTVESKGRPFPNPAITIAAECRRQMLAYQTKFGLTPSDRARMQLPGRNKEKDDLEKFLG
jgi:P27 family predicted phage terminase small subunit